MSTEIDAGRALQASAGTIGLANTFGTCDDGDSTIEFRNESETVVVRLLTASHRLRSVLADHYAEFGLSDVRHTVLQVLRDAAPEGCSQSQLADHLGQSESSVCMLVKRMRDAELLYRLRSRIDRRNWVLNLTDRGRELLRQVEECHGRRMRTLLRGFTEEDLSTLSVLLDRFVNEIEKADLSVRNPAVSSAAGTPADSAHGPHSHQAEPVFKLPPAA